MAGHRVAVAASGGRDSTALLHCTARAARALGIEVVALHVHHGLNADADAWLRQVRQQARRWGAAFDSRRLTDQPAAGDSVEAWARQQRYRALAQMAAVQRCDLVLLAHHRRDQAETWLLQALRSAGPRGLAAMPVQAQRSGVTWARPWLNLPREAIEAYVLRHRLASADDSSNGEPRFARNALRLQVWPALVAAFPQAEVQLVQAARQAQHAAALADEVAALDLPPLRQGAALQVTAWCGLPSARRRNALRAWLAATLAVPVSDTLLSRLCDELPRSTSARWPAPAGELRLYRGLLNHEEVVADALEVPSVPMVVDLSRVGSVALAPWPGHIDVQRVNQGGAGPAVLRQVSARVRSGGERFRLSASGTARSLKKQFQALGVPAWQRDGPLLFTPDGQLLFVPGLGIDAALQAAPGELQLSLCWVPDARQPAR